MIGWDVQVLFGLRNLVLNLNSFFIMLITIIMAVITI